MQSFLTIFIAGLTAFMAMFMLNPDPAPQDLVLAEQISLQQEDEAPVVPSFVIDPIYPLVLALEDSPSFEAGLDLRMEAIVPIRD